MYASIEYISPLADIVTHWKHIALRLQDTFDPAQDYQHMQYTKEVKKRIVLIPVIIATTLLLATGGYFVYRHYKKAPVKVRQITVKKVIPPIVIPTPIPTPIAQPTFDKTKLSLTDPTSIWVIVNKQHPLSPINYAPADLQALGAEGASSVQMRAVAASALGQMFTAADQAGYKLGVISGYRSYTYQTTLYNGYVSSVGQAAADQESARPGYSEHQAGLAVDIRNQDNTCSLEACFATTPEGKWLDANAYKYGFILRYPADKVDVTGYEYEPWHFRYIGTNLSQELHAQSIETLEEFFNVAGGTTYK